MLGPPAHARERADGPMPPLHQAAGAYARAGCGRMRPVEKVLPGPASGVSLRLCALPIAMKLKHCFIYFIFLKFQQTLSLLG